MLGDDFSHLQFSVTSYSVNDVPIKFVGNSVRDIGVTALSGNFRPLLYVQQSFCKSLEFTRLRQPYHPRFSPLRSSQIPLLRTPRIREYGSVVRNSNTAPLDDHV
ncbi:Hypothetical protein CINCED_3A013435 [Cinara cedri]|uniref:Uncharacterized protein n=1 Tax=Cinara cedri TaxID=506608 RepID=A0A5E4MZN4_9HEMI|nr:Hypothetical protein CINCED_3A013435 [Cinara cedri]